MNRVENKHNWPVVMGVGVVALGLGFAVARWTSPADKAPPSAGAKEATPRTGPAIVAIPDEYVASAKIVVEPVDTGNVGAEVLAPGAVVAEPGSEATVVARASGNVTQVLRVLGEPVKAGEVLARVTSDAGARMVAERRAAVARFDAARKAHVRDADLFEQGVLARQDAEASEAALAAAQAEADRARTVAAAAHVDETGNVSVVSPLTGTITATDITLGEFVDPQSVLYRIAAAKGHEIEASVRASETARIRVGDPATIIRADGSTVAGKVRAVTPTVDGITRAGTVVISPAGDGDDLVVGDGVQVRLLARGNATGELAVPEEAVQNIDGGDAVFVRTKDGFRAQPVRVGARSGGKAEILSGIAAGDRVATRNAFLVKAEMTKGGGDDE